MNLRMLKVSDHNIKVRNCVDIPSCDADFSAFLRFYWKNYQVQTGL